VEEVFETWSREDMTENGHLAPLALGQHGWTSVEAYSAGLVPRPYPD
jgi:hypothetical protein